MKKVVALNLKKLESLSPTNALSQVEIGHVVLESGEDENMKSLQKNTDRQRTAQL